MEIDKIITVPSGEVGDIIIQAYKDAGYKIKKPKLNKNKIKENKEILKADNGIFEQIKHNFYCGSAKARQRPSYFCV